jgi:hypothetical protein
MVDVVITRAGLPGLADFHLVFSWHIPFFKASGQKLT